MPVVYVLLMLSGVVVFQVGLWSLRRDMMLQLGIGYLLLSYRCGVTLSWSTLSNLSWGPSEGQSTH